MRARGEPGREDDLRAGGLAEVQDHSGHRPFTGRFLPRSPQGSRPGRRPLPCAQVTARPQAFALLAMAVAGELA
jgi:hypothetical protein